MLTDPACVDPNKEAKRKKQKTSMTLGNEWATIYLKYIVYQNCFEFCRMYTNIVHILFIFMSMNIGESAKFLAKSPYIRDLATVVIGYGMAINIVEVTWKSKLKAAFPDPNSYSMFMGNFSSATGIATLLMMLAGRMGVD